MPIQRRALPALLLAVFTLAPGLDSAAHAQPTCERYSSHAHWIGVDDPPGNTEAVAIVDPLAYVVSNLELLRRALEG